METSGRLIALVDDDKIFQLTASRTIQAIDGSTKVLQFENGEEALLYLRANLASKDLIPDFIFLDINMPFVDGWMFLQEFEPIRSQLPKPVIIYMVSSSIDPRDINRAKDDSNVSEYVVKPVTRERFKELLHKVA